ncbi:hypothetical protein NXV57_05270 [Bacteroides thetaiotaomicron]|nr:hypothetical protein [Bacteroides thetaiotaomicron]
MHILLVRMDQVKSVSLGDYYGMKESFVKNGTLATTKAKWTTRKGR